MYLKILSSKEYDSPEKNYGDCIIIINNNSAVIYDCGSKEHAERVIKELDSHKIEKATFILSHNDNDHFKGLPYLIEQGRIEKVFTILLLKYKKEILDVIDDGRRNRDSLSESIIGIYTNIASLSGQDLLRDVYQNESELPKYIDFIGPDKEYMINAAAHEIDSRIGDRLNNETGINAASVQIKVNFRNKKVLLTGDCSYEAIPSNENLNSYTHIQLPHHGKSVHAEKIFINSYPHATITFLVSDNTGNSNGGSDDLDILYKNILTTKNGDIIIGENNSAVPYTNMRLG